MRGSKKGRKKGRKAVCCLALYIACMLTGCASSDRIDKKEIKIGVVVYDEYDTFLSLLMNHFMEGVSQETKEGRSISVKRYNASGDQTIENEQVEEMIDAGCNVLCVNLVDRTDPSMIIEMARKADIPVIFFNRELVEKDLMSWDKLYYVGADAFESGTIQGEIAADAWTGAGDLSYEGRMDKNGDGILQYVVLEGEAGHQDSIVRSEYSVKALEDAQISVEKCESHIANWNRAQARTKMAQMLNKYGDSIELVLCNNDDMALGAIDEYDSRETKQENRPVIVGIDGTDVGLEAVEKGSMLGTVYNDKEGQAEAMLKLAIAAVTGEGMDEIELFDGTYIRYPYIRVTKENVSDFMTEETE